MPVQPGGHRGLPNTKQCAESAARSGLSARLDLLSSEKGWEEEYAGGRRGSSLIRGPERVGAGGGSAGPSSLLESGAPPPPRAPRYTHTQPRLDMHTQRRLRARAHAGGHTHLSPGLSPPRERRSGGLGPEGARGATGVGRAGAAPARTCE